MQKGQTLILLLIGIVVIASGAFFLTKSNGKICGGFGGEQGESVCPVGYKCQYPSPIYPDASGKCVNILSYIFPYWSTSSTTPTSSPTAVPTSDTSPVPTGSDETANWKTYTNSQYSFTVKYPSGWVVYEYPVDNRYKLVDLVITSKEKDISLSSDANPKIGFTVTVNINLHGQDTFQKSGADKDPNFVGFSYEQTKFLGLPASRSFMIWSDIIPDQGISWLYFNNNSYGWTLGWPNTNFEGDYEPVYKQMLSTFKFTQ